MGTSPIINTEGMTVSQAAEAWGCDTSRIYRLIAEGLVSVIVAADPSTGKLTKLIPAGSEKPAPKKRGSPPSPLCAGRKGRFLRLTDAELDHVRREVARLRAKASKQ